MPLFLKKEEETEKVEDIVQSFQTQEQPAEPPARTEIKTTQATPKKDQLPKGTFSVSILNEGFEFARFTIKPEIYPEAIEMIKNLISTLNEPQLKLNSNCDCIWCQQKIKELQDYLLG
jgi:DNA replicative helicase MCM subunit Mcm2 (Cdc46/Mcm family)